MKNKRKRLQEILAYLIILIIIIIFLIGLKTVIDMYIYNKCFIQPIDNNFNYNICEKYIGY